AALPAVVAAVVAGLQSQGLIIALIQIIPRIPGDKTHRTAQSVTAIQRTDRATDDFHAFQGIRIDVVALGAEEGAEGEGVRDCHAVDLSQYPVAADTADAEAGQAEAAAGAADRHPRLVAHQIADIVDVLLIDQIG